MRGQAGRSEPDPGILILAVSKNSVAARAGILGGDIITGWLQAEKEGTLASPLDVTWVEREWAPRGTVTLVGTRAGARFTWVLNSAAWGITPGPNSRNANAINLRMSEIANARQFDQLKEYCRSICMEVKPDEGVRSWLLFNAAHWLGLSDRWHDADEFYERAVQELPSDLGRLRGIIYDDWGELFKKHTDWSRAQKCYSLALAEDGKAGGESLLISNDLLNLALISFRLGDLSDADQLATRSLHIRRKLSPNTLDVAKGLNYLGVFAMQNGDLDSAEDFLRQSLQVAIRINRNSREAAFAYSNLGAISIKRGDLATSETFFLRDIDISSRLDPEDYFLSYSWSNLGSIAFRRGNLQRAKQYYLKALAIQEKREKRTDESMTLANLANVFEESGELPEAENLLRKAPAIQEQTSPNSIELAETIETLGTVLQREDRLGEAEQNLTKALALGQTLSPNSLEVAEILYEFAEINRKHGDLQRARERHSAALQIRKTLAPRSAAYAESLFALGGIDWTEGQRNAAIQNYDAGLNVLDAQAFQLGGASESHLHFHSRYASYYSQYISLLMEDGKVERAFEVLERSRSQTLLQTLAQGHVDVRTGVPPVLLKQHRNLQSTITALADQRLRLLSEKRPANQIAEIDQKIADLLSEQERSMAQIRATSPRYASLTQPHSLRVTEIQQLLDDETVLLEYSLGGEHSYLFVVTRKNLTCFGLPSRQVIDGFANRVYEA